MPCCGNARQTKPSGLQPGNLVLAPLPASAVYFEYVGKTRLAVIGRTTRKLYSFHGPAARVAVDSRDAASLASFPMLRRV
jgi:hypothetical protein